MGYMKNYLLTVLENCSDEKFGQEAVEWAIVTGRVVLTYNLETDLKTIMGDCVTANTSDRPAGETNYDRIIEDYRRQCQEHGDALAARQLEFRSVDGGLIVQALEWLLRVCHSMMMTGELRSFKRGHGRKGLTQLGHGAPCANPPSADDMHRL